MAQTIKLKRSGTQNAVPTTSQLALGEVAINTYDGKMYIKKNDGSDSIVEIGGDATSSSGLDLTGNLNLADNVRIVIGDGNDLQIYHDGSHSYIQDSGTGNLFVRADNLVLTDADGTQFLRGTANTDVKLYYANAIKFTTTSAGAQVTGKLFISDTSNGLEIGASKARFKVNGDDTVIDAIPTGGGINFRTGGAVQRMHIDENGNVGIGTTSPANTTNYTTLDIRGTSGGQFLLGRNSFDFFIYSASNVSHIGSAADQGLAFHTDSSGASNERMRIDSDGRVGIGTASPAHPLHIKGIGTNHQLRVERTGTGNVNLGVDTVGAFVEAQSNIPLRFYESNAERMRIDGGNVGIGTTAPEDEFHILLDSSTDGPSFRFTNPNGGDGTYLGRISTGDVVGSFFAGINFLKHDTNDGEIRLRTKVAGTNTDVLTIVDGNVAIGNTTAGAKLDIRQDSGYAIRAENASGHYFRVAAGGAIEVGGSAFVDASRNITVGTISSGGITTSGILDFTSATATIRNQQDNSGQIALQVKNSSGTAREVRWDAANNVNGAWRATTNGAADLGLTNKIWNNLFVNTIKMGTSNIEVIDSSRNISAANITTTGYLRGPSTFTIDPAAHGDNTGTVVIAGNLQVDGTTTTINSTTLTVDDKNITLASGSTNGSAANGAGLTVDCGSNEDATWTYSFGDDAWKSNKHILAYTGDGTGVFAVGRDANQAIQIDVDDTTNRITAHQDSDENGDHFFDLIRDFDGTGKSDFRILNGSDVHMLIDKTGNVGIGTTSPASLLNVYTDAGRDFRVDHGTANRTILSTDRGMIVKAGAGYSLDLDTGSANGTIRFLDNGTVHSVFDASGNLGIGTTSPTANLVVTQSGNTPTSGFHSNQWQGCFVNTGSTSSIARVGIYSGNATTALLNFGDADDADIGGLSYDNSDNSLAIRTNNAEHMRITSAGNVGIGTTSPQTNLQVNGANQTFAAHFGQGTANSLGNWGGISLGYSEASNNNYRKVGIAAKAIGDGAARQELHFLVDANSDGNNADIGDSKMMIDISGNVGIGTTSPAADLHVNGTWTSNRGTISINGPANALTGVGITSNNIYRGGLIHRDGTAGQSLELTAYSSESLLLKTTNTTRLAITSGGNVGIGTTAPGYPLEISGAGTVSLAYQRTGTGVTAKKWGFHSDNSNTYWQNITDSLLAITVSNAGKVGIGTAAPQSKLEVNLASGSTSSLMDANTVNDVQLIRAPFSSSAATTSNAGAKWGLRFVGRNDSNYDNQKSGAIYAVSEDSGAGYNRYVGLAFHTSGFDSNHAERMRITNTGNVGINDTTPTRRLTVAGDIGVGNGNKIYLWDSHNLNYIKYDEWTTSASGGMNITNQASTGSLSLRTVSAVRLHITSGGDVGIGTTAPAAPLHVKHATGEAKVLIQAGSNTSSAVLQFGDSLDSSRGGIEYTSTDDMAFSTNNMTEAMRIRYTGNVGIGTSNPQQKVHASSSGITYFRATGGSGNTGIDFGQHSNGSAYIWHRDAASLLFGTDSTERLRLAATGAITFNSAFTFPTSDGGSNQVLKTDGSGNVTWATVQGVGTATEIADADGDTKIQVEESSDEDKIRFDAAGVERFRIGSDIEVIAATDFNITGANRRLNFTSGTGTIRVTGASSLHLATNNTNRISIDSNGRVGIGHSAANAQLHVNSGNNTSVSIGDATNPAIQVGGTTNYRFGVYTDGEAGYIENKNGDDGLVFRVKTAGEAMRIDGGTGRVGIGTASPNYKLDVLATGGGINIGGTGAFLRWNSGDIQIKNEGSYKMGFYTYNSSDAALNQHMVIDTNGKVGIGTTSPSAPLHLKGTGDTTLIVEADSDNSGETDNARIELRQDGNNVAGYLYTEGNAGQTATGTIPNTTVLESKGGGNDVGIHFATGGKAPSQSGGPTNGTVRMTVLGSGNVGIGTTAPSQKLSVNGNIYSIGGFVNASGYQLNGTYVVDSSRNLVNIGTIAASGIVNIGGGTSYFSEKLLVSGRTRIAGQLDISLGTGYGNFGKITHNDSVLKIETVRSAGSNGQIHLAPLGTTALALDTASNVGIGTTSPAGRLDVQENSTGSLLARVWNTNTSGTGTSVLRIANNGNNAQGSRLEFTDQAYYHGSISSDRTNGIQFGTNATGNTGVATERMRIATNGNVGIGTTNPLYALQVAGQIYANGGGIFLDSGYRLKWGNSQQFIEATNSGPMQFGTGNSERMRISSSGEVGIATTGPLSGHKLTVNGKIGGLTYIDSYVQFTGGNAILKANDDVILGYTSSLYVKQSGNVGIGTSSPTYKLHVLTGAGSQNIFQAGQSGVSNGLSITTDGSALTYSFLTGKVGIGTSSPDSKLTVNVTSNSDGIELQSSETKIASLSRTVVSSQVVASLDGVASRPIHIGGIVNEDVILANAGGNVGIGTTTPDEFGIGGSFKILSVGGDRTGVINIIDDGVNGSYLQFGTAAGLRRASMHAINGSHLVWTTNGSNSGTGLTERMRLTSGGYLMIGKTNPTFSDSGIELRSGNLGARFTRSNAEPILVNRTGSNGNIVLFYGQGTHIGSIGTGDGNSVYIECPVSTKVGLDFRSDILPRSGGALSNGGVDLGAPSYRFRSIELSAAVNVGHASIQTDSTTTSATTQVVIDAFVASEFRSAEFTIQVTNTTDSTYHLTKVLLIHNGTTPGITEYGTVFTGSAAEATFDADISSGNVRLLATPASTDSMTFKVLRHSITA